MSLCTIPVLVMPIMFAGMIVAAAMKEQLPIQRSSPDKNPLGFEIDGSTDLDTITFASPLPRHRLRSTNVTLEKESRAPGDNDVSLVLDRTHGGSILFDMKVDPISQNHITVKFWGDTAIVNGTAFMIQQNTWLYSLLQTDR